VCDDDKLRLVLELCQQADVPADVRVVERRVDLVEQAERARLGEEDREQQRHRNQRALARREQVDPLGAFASGAAWISISLSSGSSSFASRTSHSPPPNSV